MYDKQMTQQESSKVYTQILQDLFQQYGAQPQNRYVDIFQDYGAKPQNPYGRSIPVNSLEEGFDQLACRTYSRNVTPRDLGSEPPQFSNPELQTFDPQMDQFLLGNLKPKNSVNGACSSNKNMLAPKRSTSTVNEVNENHAKPAQPSIDRKSSLRSHKANHQLTVVEKRTRFKASTNTATFGDDQQISDQNQFEPQSRKRTQKQMQKESKSLAQAEVEQFAKRCKRGRKEQKLNDFVKVSEKKIAKWDEELQKGAELSQEEKKKIRNRKSAQVARVRAKAESKYYKEKYEGVKERIDQFLGTMQEVVYEETTGIIVLRLQPGDSNGQKLLAQSLRRSNSRHSNSQGSTEQLKAAVKEHLLQDKK